MSKQKKETLHISEQIGLDESFKLPFHLFDESEPQTKEVLLQQINQLEKYIIKAKNRHVSLEGTLTNLKQRTLGNKKEIKDALALVKSNTTCATKV